MRTFALTVLVFVMFVSSPVVVGSEEVSVEKMPPVVVRTIPESGAANVDPSLPEINFVSARVRVFWYK